ncbi:unnamed protein product, partial [Closterium sp. Yama58-4]
MLRHDVTHLKAQLAARDKGGSLHLKKHLRKHLKHLSGVLVNNPEALDRRMVTKSSEEEEGGRRSTGSSGTRQDERRSDSRSRGERLGEDGRQSKGVEEEERADGMSEDGVDDVYGARTGSEGEEGSDGEEDDGRGGGMGESARALMALWEAGPSLGLRDVRSAAVQRYLTLLRRAVGAQGGENVGEKGTAEGKEGDGKEMKEGVQQAKRQAGALEEERQFEAEERARALQHEAMRLQAQERMQERQGASEEQAEVAAWMAAARDEQLLGDRADEDSLSMTRNSMASEGLLGAGGEQRDSTLRTTGARFLTLSYARSTPSSQVSGADEENLPMSRRAQRDMWVHQLPRDCSSSISLPLLCTLHLLYPLFPPGIRSGQPPHDAASPEGHVVSAAPTGLHCAHASVKFLVSAADEDNLPMTRRAQRDMWLLQHPRDCLHPAVKFLVVDVLRTVSGGDEDNLPMTRRAQRDIWVHQHPRDCAHPSVRFLVVDVLRTVKNRPTPCIPQVSGADEDNLPMTRRAQRDIWLLQHPRNCSHPSVKFLVVDVLRTVRGRFLGVGAQVNCIWGRPWKHMHPTVDVHGRLIRCTAFNRHRWWFAQAATYLMRYPSPRLCLLLNRARHRAFGPALAARAARFLPADWPKTVEQLPEFTSRNALGSEGKIEDIWQAASGGLGSTGALPGAGGYRGAGGYLPEGLVAVHVRQGDKAGEMAIAGLEVYAALLGRVRRQFPYADSVWLSTEMQAVVDAAKQYTRWRFHVTDFPRQALGESMDAYDARVGEQRATDNAYVNLLMCADAPFFVGTMGST